VQGHKRQKREIYLLRKVAGRGGIVAPVASIKAATGVSMWLVGQGIKAVSEIEETARISRCLGRENQAAD